jgi:hypothetical protein
MTTSFNGTTGITYSDGSTQSNSQVGMKNRIIDGGFIINQRAYVSNTALSAGVYAHDRWKAGSGGCTYTFTQGSLGVNTTITITAGTLVQVIEGCNLAEGGTYVLSWTGTAQGRLNGGTYGSSGTITVTGWTAGTNLNVEFNTGTVGSVQLEKGSTATSFDYRPYGTELALCQRYAWIIKGANQQVCNGFVRLAANFVGIIQFPVTMRTNAALTVPNSAGYFNVSWGSSDTSMATIAIGGGGTLITENNALLQATLSGATVGQGGVLALNNSSSYVLFTAEL